MNCNKNGDSRLYYTPEMAGSGQFGICFKCNKKATKEGHDGCLGTLPDKNIMNACCGHGKDSMAYIQYWTRKIIRGNKAILEQKRLTTNRGRPMNNNEVAERFKEVRLLHGLNQLKFSILL